MRERRGVAKDVDLCNGPGKLTQALGIDLELNDTNLYEGPILHPPARGRRRRSSSSARASGSPRRWSLPWRFSAAGSRHVSQAVAAGAGRAQRRLPRRRRRCGGALVPPLVPAAAGPAAASAVPACRGAGRPVPAAWSPVPVARAGRGAAAVGAAARRRRRRGLRRRRHRRRVAAVGPARRAAGRAGALRRGALARARWARPGGRRRRSWTPHRRQALLLALGVLAVVDDLVGRDHEVVPDQRREGAAGRRRCRGTRSASA